MATISSMMAMLVTVAVTNLVIGVDMQTTDVMMTMRLIFYHPNSTRGGVATAVSENAAHTNTWPYHARIRSTPKLALRRGAEARPARSRRMASAEGRRWQSLAQPFVCRHADILPRSQPDNLHRPSRLPTA